MDLISAASGGVTAAGLTILGGLNGFQSFADGTAVTQAEISAAKNLAITQFITLKDAGLNAIETTIAGTKAPLTAQFVSDQTALTNQLVANQTNRLTQYDADAALINTYIPELNAAHALDIANLDAAKAAAEASYLGVCPT